MSPFRTPRPPASAVNLFSLPLMQTQNHLIADDPRIPPRIQRPSFRWSDIWRAPLHDFPIRDEILYQYLPLSAGMDVLEIGPGSGFTAFRLARQVRSLTLVDVAVEVVTDLDRQLSFLNNVSTVCADVSQPGLAKRLDWRFDAAYALDVFEYLKNPGICLSNLAEVIRPGGSLLISYPNVPPPEGDGVTFFSNVAALDGLIKNAGFCRWETFAVRLRPWAAKTYRGLHEWPLRSYRWLHHQERDGQPQTYEATWAFRHRRKLLPYKIPLHFLWATLDLTIKAGGGVFGVEPIVESILGRQLVIRAWK